MMHIVASEISNETLPEVVVEIEKAKHSISSSSSMSLTIVMLTHSTLPSSVTVREPLSSVKSPGAVKQGKNRPLMSPVIYYQ